MTSSPERVNFRRRIVNDLFRVIGLPPLILSAVAHLLHLRLGWWSLPAYLLSIILAAVARVQYTQFIQRREANQLGARPIPRLVGKWPGNIDVMLKTKKAFASGYLYNHYLELFEEYQCTTLNTRFLWMDNVSMNAPIDLMLDTSICRCADNFHGRGTCQICPLDRVQSLLARDSSTRAAVSLCAFLGLSPPQRFSQGKLSGRWYLQPR